MGARDDAAHLFRRAAFGAAPAELDELQQLDRPALVDRVMDVSGAPPVERPSALSDPSTSKTDAHVAIIRWWLDRMRTSPAPFLEKATLLWHGHFATSVAKVDSPWAMWRQNRMLRANALGSFRDLAHAVAVDPAMLVFLDGASNIGGSPNENFARELLELFTVGVGHYTQSDISALARAWTGHGLDATGTTYQFWPSRHDDGLKTFLGATKAWDGPDALDYILDGPLRRVHAEFLARKAWTAFAYPDPAPAVIGAVAEAYLESELDLRALFRAMFLHPEFWSTRARLAVVRTPTEWVVAGLRATGVCADAVQPERWMGRMGQLLFRPPDVSGWPQGRAWVSTAATWARGAFARQLAATASSVGVLADSQTVPVADAVQRCFDTLSIVTPSASTRAALENAVIAERRSGGGTEAWNLLTLGLLSPDFQLA